MSHIYGCVKLTLTGPEEVMKRGLEVLKTVYIDDSCVSYIEGTAPRCNATTIA